MIDNNTTQRIVTTDLLDAIKNVERRRALLHLRYINRNLKPAEKQEYEELGRKLDKLQKEYRDQRAYLDARQRAAAAADPNMQRAKANIRRIS